MDIFLATLSQMTTFFIFMAIGYIFKKISILPDNSGTVLSRLLLYVFLPALSFNTFSKNLTQDTVADKLPFLLASLVMLAVTFALALGLARLFSSNKNTQAVFVYAFTIPNLGYVGYPLVEQIFGTQTLLDYMIFCLPLNIFIYTVGMYILNPKREMNLKKLLNPSIIAILLGSAVGLLGWQLPTVVTSTLSAAASCMGPLAMLLRGFVLARDPLKEMLCSGRMYVAALIRLIVMPALVGAALYFLGVDPYIGVLACCALALPMGLNNIVFPEAFGGDSKTGAQSCFVSNVLGLITVPIAYMIVAAVFGG